MKFTFDKPTEEGFYWYRRTPTLVDALHKKAGRRFTHASLAYVVEVRESDFGSLRVVDDGDIYQLNDCTGQFAGPIPPPEPDEFD